MYNVINLCNRARNGIVCNLNNFDFLLLDLHDGMKKL
jgi:hypothetical protein